MTGFACDGDGVELGLVRLHGEGYLGGAWADGYLLDNGLVAHITHGEGVLAVWYVKTEIAVEVGVCD